ncbi:Ntn hydrolase family protein [Xanthobacter flavus]|uniref:peptidase S14 n=1 Tax=Xanthobacter flavus TaxID=281 RepID=UPI00372C0577
MAADRRAYSGDKLPVGEKTKIERLSDGSLLGASTGTPGYAEHFRRLVEERGVTGVYPADMKVQALLVRPNGEVFYFKDGEAFSGPLEGPFFAIGSGAEYATGALMAGVSATRAVKIACECDVWSGGGVDGLAIQEADIDG